MMWCRLCKMVRMVKTCDQEDRPRWRQFYALQTHENNRFGFKRFGITFKIWVVRRQFNFGQTLSCEFSTFHDIKWTIFANRFSMSCTTVSKLTRQSLNTGNITQKYFWQHKLNFTPTIFLLFKTNNTHGKRLHFSSK